MQRPDRRFSRFAPRLAEYVSGRYRASEEIDSYRFFERLSAEADSP